MVREAREEDLDAIVGMGAQFHALSTWRDIPFSPDKFRAAAERMIADEGMTIFVNEALTGMIGMTSGPIYFADNVTVTQEAFWWCQDPKSSIRLLLRAEEWSRRIGARWSCMVRLEGVTPRLEAYYRRHGYRPTEHYYLKEL